MRSGRLILDQARTGAWNMSIDEALLESASRENIWTLRFYCWSEPTLSLGYFQSYQDREQHQSSSNSACVRRSTGGGAILHDHELTYSLCVPGTDRFSRKSEFLYDVIHDAIIEYLNETFQEDVATKSVSSPQKPEPFLCFQRRANGDILMEQQKVCGSAQRRWKNALLQHGSILLRKSEFAPELLGIEEICSSVEIAQLQSFLVDKLEKHFQLTFEETTLCTELLDYAANIHKKKYYAHQWLKKR